MGVPSVQGLVREEQAKDNVVLFQQEKVCSIDVSVCQFYNNIINPGSVSLYRSLSLISRPSHIIVFHMQKWRGRSGSFITSMSMFGI